MYEYGAQLIRVIDGDTLHVTILLGLDVSINGTIRLAGINCPEMSTQEGVAARGFVEDWFAKNAPSGRFVLRTVKDRREKYGRYLGTVVANGATLNTDLLTAGMAVVYEVR